MPRKIFRYMRHEKILTIKVSVWQQCKEGEMGLCVSIQKLWLEEVSRNCADCQEWPRHLHILQDQPWPEPPSNLYLCLHTLFFNIYGICKSWLGGVSKSEEATVPALLEESQCLCSPESPGLTFWLLQTWMAAAAILFWNLLLRKF